MKQATYFATSLFLALLLVLSACGKDPSCGDGIQNQGERGVDCCGPCEPCPTIPDCTTPITVVTPTCFDGIQNGDEEGVDCGGSCAEACDTGGDTPCTNGVQDIGEEGVDCGGDCPPCVVLGDGGLSVAVDGVNLIFDAGEISTSFLEGFGLNIVGSSTGLSGIESIQITIPEDQLAVGSYAIGATSGLAINYTEAGSVEGCAATSGTVNIVAIDLDNQTISGTFAFECTTPGGSSSTGTNGEFANISW